MKNPSGQLTLNNDLSGIEIAGDNGVYVDAFFLNNMIYVFSEKAKNPVDL